MQHVLVFSTSTPHAILTETLIVGLLNQVGLPTAKVYLNWLASGHAADMPWDETIVLGIAPLR